MNIDIEKFLDCFEGSIDEMRKKLIACKLKCEGCSTNYGLDCDGCMRNESNVDRFVPKRNELEDFKNE